MTTLLDIPLEILCLIADYLDYPSCICLDMTCKHCHGICSNSRIWKNKMAREFSLSNHVPKDCNYRRMYLGLLTPRGIIYPGSESNYTLMYIASNYLQIEERYRLHFELLFGPSELSTVLSVAPMNDNNLDFVKRIVKKGAIIVGAHLTLAANDGAVEVFKFIEKHSKECGRNEYMEAISVAVHNDRPEIVEYLEKSGKCDNLSWDFWNKMVKKGVEQESEHWLNYGISKGGSDFIGCIGPAIRTGNTNMLELLFEHGHNSVIGISLMYNELNRLLRMINEAPRSMIISFERLGSDKKVVKELAERSGY